jgi:hypothetical protein
VLAANKFAHFEQSNFLKNAVSDRQLGSSANAKKEPAHREQTAPF